MTFYNNQLSNPLLRGLAPQVGIAYFTSNGQYRGDSDSRLEGIVKGWLPDIGSVIMSSVR